ncbi:DeoR/GlpR family DNA-binding transcription regulator [Carboxydochorda subterranea]|uniref:DeoR/GlpR family DNA-binding transcription regulator n=1 Tax=Carboxydichorda subterranea TaxID=3109565 RepID=A0ABZ1BXU2_9FIRM|nr:DeoR/GlpR family DNA-binding transcription regulator [Limnochorda sp. L945t]WRP17445.1 DeoR/GlpR family DNA-binding transcription regulator [Limnochorda sp. L945t]
MLSEQRRLEISSLVRRRGAVGVAELVQLFKVTPATVRKDLTALHKAGMLVRTRGGALAPNYGHGRDLPVSVRQTMLSTEKLRIAEKARAYVKPGDTIYLDGSSTVGFLARLLDEIEELTVVTNSLLVMQQVALFPKARLLGVAGTLHRDSLSFLGGDVEDALRSYHVDKAFISTKGVSIGSGLTDAQPEWARIHRIVLQSADHIMLLADQSKFGTVSLVTVAPLSKVNVVVTDAEPQDPYRSFLEEHGVELAVAEAKKESGLSESQQTDALNARASVR